MFRKVKVLESKGAATRCSFACNLQCNSDLGHRLRIHGCKDTWIRGLHGLRIHGLRIHGYMDGLRMYP